MTEDNKNSYTWVVIFCVVLAIGLVWGWVELSKPPSYEAQASCYTASEATSHVGSHGCVTYTVGYTYKSSAGNIFLDQYQNYTSGFAVYIPVGSSASSINPSDYDNKEITVTGDISEYKGGTQIEVTDISQIQGGN